MTPHFAFATALLYCMAADGERDNEEVGHLLSVLGGSNDGGSIGVGAQNQKLLDRAVQCVRTKSVDEFLAEAVPLLTDAQKICILCKLIDSALSDGEAEPEEQVLITKIQDASGIFDERFKPFFDVLMAKCDITGFVNGNHPANAPGHVAKISGLN